jgi:UrcA family protein
MKIRTLALAVLFALPACATQPAAAEHVISSPQKTSPPIRSSDLDLSTEGGRATLASRILYRMHAVCGRASDAAETFAQKDGFGIVRAQLEAYTACVDTLTLDGVSDPLWAEAFARAKAAM